MRISQKERRLLKEKEKSEETRRLHTWFKEIWDEREDEDGYCYCFETGRRMNPRIYRDNTCCYDHVLEKSPFPQYKFVKKNIIIILPDVHTLKGSNVSKCPKIKKYQDYLLTLHEEENLKD